MNRQDKLINHIRLTGKGVATNDGINLRIRRQTKPYGVTRTVLTVEVFELEDQSHAMTVSATRTKANGKPRGLTQRAYFFQPEGGQVEESLSSIKPSVGLTPYVVDCEGAETIEGFNPDGISSVVKLSYILNSFDIYSLLFSLIIPFQGLQKWLDPAMLEALNQEWNDLREGLVQDLTVMLFQGAR